MLLVSVLQDYFAGERDGAGSRHPRLSCLMSTMPEPYEAQTTTLILA
jgi:hypothetical protein